MGNTLQNKVIQFHEKIIFDFLKKIRNYLVANPIYYFEQSKLLEIRLDLKCLKIFKMYVVQESIFRLVFVRQNKYDFVVGRWIGKIIVSVLS